MGYKSMSTNKDLLSLWMEHQKDSTDNGLADSSQLDKSKDNYTLQPVESEPIQEIPPERRAKPLLNGQLSEFLSKKPPREILTSSELLTSKTDAWTIEERDDRAVVAMSLILTSHLVRFGQTRLSENHLLQMRDSILHTMTANDAVKIEVEAYEILNWFAQTMNASWKETKTDSECSSIECIIQYAIQHHIDLEMHYYTGSRGEYSERRITPIEITAEKYLIAYCHLRNEERVFRLSRIVQLSPAEKIEEYEKLCYPKEKDTQLPPLPTLPQNKSQKSSRRKKTTSEENAAQNIKKKKSKKSSETKTESSKQLELMDNNTDSKTQMDKTAKAKKKESHINNTVHRQMSLFES